MPGGSGAAVPQPGSKRSREEEQDGGGRRLVFDDGNDDDISLAPAPAEGLVQEGYSAVLVLDGGMGDELRVRNPMINWSPLELQSSEQLIVDCHAAYIEAGATVIETWNYSATPYWIREQPGWSTLKSEPEVMELWEELTRTSVRLAKRAIKESGKKNIRIAGAMPPLLSTYDLTEMPDGQMLQQYTQMARSLHEEGCDLFLIETCAKISFAEVALQACASVCEAKETWVSFTLQDAEPLIWSGESISSACTALGDAAANPRRPDGLLFNCAPPEVISQAIALARPLWAGRLGGYGNRLGTRKSYGPQQAARQRLAQGEAYSPRAGGRWAKREELGPEQYAAWAKDWQLLGADVVGGCCGIGPAHIEAVAEVL